MKPTIDIVPAHFRKYVGTRPMLSSPRDRAAAMAFSLIAECMCAPSAPHWTMARNSLQLCPETEGLIYGRNFGFLDKPYRRGSRPMLEQFVDEYIDTDMTEREKMLAILKAVHQSNLHPKFGHVPVFLYGETEEQTLLKGGGHCSCRSRMLTALFQVAGLQARPLMMWVVPDPTGKIPFLGGHTVAEVHVDGGWVFVDPLPGLYCVKPDGSLASIRDLQRNPKLLTSMPAELVATMGTSSEVKNGVPFVESFAHRFFHPACPILISRYDINDVPTPTWNWADDAFRAKQSHDYDLLKQFCNALADRGELTDEVYHLDHAAFQARFKLDLQLAPPRDAFAPAKEPVHA